MMWKFAVLEIYTHDLWGNEWPAEGTPAVWIEQDLVAWGEADIQDFYAHIPLKSILTAKLTAMWEWMRDMLPFYKDRLICLAAGHKWAEGTGAYCDRCGRLKVR